MQQQKGNLSVNTENLMPIIKKWLYSDRDIFLRELVSNACDAVSKLNKIASLGEAKPVEKPEVRVQPDAEAGTITVEDNGIGMTAEEIEKYIPPKTRTYEKIQRQDIARLPRTQWHLANNSFLLHGFYNYHHLLYIEEGENRWIGVPGIYHEKEQAAARTFGFPQFHRVMDAELELSAEEKNTFDDFGYWCRQI